MKILLINAIGKKKFGGGEKWVLNAAKGLQNRNHTVYLGCRPGSILEARAKNIGIPVRHFNILSDLSIYNVIKLARFLKKEQIDVVLSKNWEFGVTGIAAWLAGTPIVIARHGLPLRRNFFKHRFLLKRFADGIIVNAQATKDMYTEKGWFTEDFITVIYNGVDIDTSGDPIFFNALYPGKSIILSVGRLTPQKGFSYLVDAAAILKKKRSDFMIIVLGEGKLRDVLHRQTRSAGVEDFVQFFGFVQNAFPYIKGCDFFVLPSLYEGLSNAAIEAMACEKPVILTDVNGSREIVVHGVHGIIVPPRDAEALAKAMNELLSDDDRRTMFGVRASEYVRERFNIDGMVRDLERYFEEKLK